MKTPEQVADTDQEALGWRLTRRQFLVGAGIVAGACGAEIYNTLSPKFRISSPEAENLEPTLVGVGVFAVYKGANIRTSPKIPDRSRFRKPNNTVGWDEIDTVNGVGIRSKSAFLIVNPAIVEGQDTYSGYGGAEWIKLTLTRGELATRPCYINYSRQTEEFVKWLGFAGYAGENNASPLYDYIGRINKEDLGKVIVPGSVETMAQDTMPKLWTERMKNKFDGKLGQGDEILTNLKVIPFGSEEQITEMIKDKTPVNAREYPSLKYRNGESVKIVGRIPQGTVIDKVLVPPKDDFHYRFAAVRSEDIRGPLLNAQNCSFPPATGEIYAIYLSYLSAI